jgi:polysaccharide biosynthesis protein PslG
MGPRGLIDLVSPARRRRSRGRSLALLLCAIAVAISGCGGSVSVAAPASGGAQPRLPALGVDAQIEGITAAQRHAEFSQLATMGASWIRVSASWLEVEPSKGAVDGGKLHELDQVIADAASEGMRTLIIGTDQIPDWAGGGTASASEAYGSFMGVLAQHFRGRGPGGTSPAYEIVNEPNGVQEDGQTWAPTDYAHAACSSFRAIKSHDPAAVVAAGSLGDLDASGWEPWLRAAFKAGLGGCFDVLSTHPYSGWDVLNQVRRVAAAEGSPGVPIWVTEFGFPTCGLESCVSETEQANSFVERIEEIGRDYPWVPVAIMYEAWDEPQALEKGPEERAFGLFRRTNNGAVGKPAVGAIQALYRRS